MPLLRQSMEAGLRAIQLRERDLEARPLLGLAEEVLPLARRHGAALFINDRVDLAIALGLDGVHLRADSLPVTVTRRMLGPGRMIGVSAHSADEVVRAESDGADFAVLGPVFETASKLAFGPPIGLRALEEASRRCRMPVFAIGGITAARVGEVRRAGARGVAVVSAILSAGSVEAATRQLLDALTATP